jgi:hypothetical protein
MPIVNYLEIEAAAEKRRRKELSLFVLACSLVFLVVLFCAWTVVINGLANDKGKLAMGLLVTILSALLGYIAGKSAK